MKKREAAPESSPRKRPRHLWFAIAALAAVVLAGVALVLLGPGGRLRTPPYDAAQPTASKFEKISRWISPHAEFDIAVDVQKALGNPEFRDRLTALVAGRQDLASELVAALLEKQSIIGMLLLVGTEGKEGAGGPSIAVIAQGNFDEQSFIPAIRAILASGKAGLVAGEVGGRTFYAESDERDPFGFVVLDGQHIAVGDRDSLAALFSDGPSKRAPVTVPAETILFGHMAVGPRIRALLPPGLSSLAGIEFASTDGKSIVARIAAGGALEAGAARMFLEGIRSLLLLQGEENPALEKLLRGIAVDEAQGQIVISCDVSSLLDLWSPPATESPPVTEQTQTTP